MSKENYLDLLECLSIDTYCIIIAVIQDGQLIDWVPAAEYCTVQEAKTEHDWPTNAQVALFYGLDALLRFSDPSVLH